MRAKPLFAVALSRGAELLVLDEATSELDPIVRDDILDMLLEFVQDEGHSILISSHITSDLEKVADYITFIHGGRLLFSHPKDELVDVWGIISCGEATFRALDRSNVIAWRKEDYQYKVLVKDRRRARHDRLEKIVKPATIDETMLFYVKGTLL